MGSDPCVRRVDVATGHTTTLAGSVPGFQDGEAHQAAFHYPNSVAVSPDGGFVFVSDAWNHRIRAVVLGTGVVTTVAGKGFPGFKDGGRADARFYYPAGIALSPDGSTLFVSDRYGRSSWSIRPFIGPFIAPFIGPPSHSQMYSLDLRGAIH